MRNWGDTWFCGVQCSQYYVDFLIWEKMLNRYVAARIVEIGTLWGGFSLYLCAQAIQRNMSFDTFDDRRCDGRDHTTGPMGWDTPLGELFGLRERTHWLDVFAEGEPVIQELVGKPGRTILFCDGGNKPREFATFAPAAKQGDIIVVHDWGTEIRPTDIDRDLVVEIMLEEAEKYGSLSRFFMRDERHP